MNASSPAGVESIELVSAYGYIRSEEKEDKNGGCRAAGHGRDDLSAKLKRGAVSVDLENFGVAVLKTMMDGSYGLGGGGAKNL